MKMEQQQYMTSEVDGYLDLYRDLMAKVNDSAVAVCLIEQIGKDRRTQSIMESRPNIGNASNGDDSGASQKQLSYLKRLGITPSPGISKKEASRLIDEARGA